MLNLIIGPTNSGKTTFICEKFFNLPNNIIVFPTQVQKDHFIKRFSKDKKILNTSFILTLRDLVEKTKPQDTSKVITNFEASILFEKVYSENKKNLSYLNHTLDSRNIINLIFGLIQDIKSKVLRNVFLPRLDHISDSKTACKWKDLYTLFDLYQDALQKNNFLDNNDLFYEGSLNIKNTNVLKNISSLILDGFTHFSEIQWYFLSTLIHYLDELQKDSYLTLLDTPSTYSKDTLKTILNDFKNAKIEKYESKAPINDVFYNSIFKNSFEKNKKIPDFSTTHIEGKNVFQEIELVINEIYRLSFEKDIPLKDIALICKKSSSYHQLLVKKLEENKFPYTSSFDIPLKENPLIQFIYQLVHMGSEGFDNIDLMQIANSNYVIRPLWKNLKNIFLLKNWIKGDSNYWYNYLSEQINKLTKELNHDNSENEEQNQKNKLIKNKLENILENFDITLGLLSPQKNDLTLKEYILWISKLFESLEINKSLENENQAFQTRDFMAFRKLKDELSALYNMYKSLSIEDHKISNKEFGNLFSFLLQKVSYRYARDGQNNINILSMLDAHEKSFKAVFILGLCDDHISTNEDYFLNHEKQEINQKAKKMLFDDLYYFISSEWVEFYISCTRATSYLYLCSHRKDIKGNDLLSSPLLQNILSLKKNFPISFIPSQKDSFTPLKEELPLSLSQKNINLFEIKTLLNQNFKDLPTKTQYSLIQNNSRINISYKMKKFQKIINQLNDTVTFFDENMMFLGKLNNTQKLYSNHSFSSSKLQRLGNCRYSFFFSDILKLAEFKYPTNELSITNLGNFYHYVLENYVKKTKDFTFSMLPDLKILDECINSYDEFFSNKKTLPFFLIIEKQYLAKQLRFFISHTDKKLRENGGKPLYQEYSLEKTVRVSNEKEIDLQGTVDRIDSIEEKYIIYDYKTKESTIKAIKEKEKIPLHLFQGYLYALLFGKESMQISFLSIENNSIEHLIFPKKTKKDEQFIPIEDMIDLKLKEINLLLNFIEKGNLMPFLKKDEIPEEIFEYYKTYFSKKEKDILIESKTKCEYCPFKALCLRKNKLLQNYHFSK